jgi:hypothetical protein
VRGQDNEAADELALLGFTHALDLLRDVFNTRFGPFAGAQ